MLEQSRELIGPWGSVRISYLKELFNNILDKLLPFEFQLILYCYDNITLQKWLRLQKAKRKKFTDMVDNDRLITDESKHSDYNLIV